MSDAERFTRQERLAEVGPRGQERIERFTAVIRGADAADVERAYLAGAGVGTVKVETDMMPDPFAHAAAFEFAAARDVGAGAWRALASVRRALGMDRK
ncbi:MAG TPA: hypothetical protein VH062_19630 [Polyangiaceae bacterium]|jgi:hypothetical protein|nr:hypothetical protein [Polyangiaceae bacterium]